MHWCETALPVAPNRIKTSVRNSISSNAKSLKHWCETALPVAPNRIETSVLNGVTGSAKSHLETIYFCDLALLKETGTKESGIWNLQTYARSRVSQSGIQSISPEGLLSPLASLSSYKTALVPARETGHSGRMKAVSGWSSPRDAAGAAS